MCVDATKCNGHGSLTPDSEPGLWTRAWTDKDMTWGKQARQGRGMGKGRDVALRRNNC